MPLFSEHIANIYYGSSSPYTASPYSSYSSSLLPLGSSYSASYLNPGGTYSNHSSLGGYSRAPLSSRWITSSGRNYSPMLSTISERGSASPIRINSPRRLPYSTRTYGTPSYTPRPVNINTADIDVSRDKYRHKIEPSPPRPRPPKAIKESPPKESSSDDKQNGPFMPRVDGKPETGIDSSPGVPRTTIKRGRTVVRLYTIKRKERDSPRKPTEEQLAVNDTNEQVIVANVDEDTKKDEKEFMKWREKLSDDLVYKEKKEKKTLGAKLMEKFVLKDDKDSEIPTKIQKKEIKKSESVPTTPAPRDNFSGSKVDRRCSVELLAEQCNLLDSLIRSENLSIGTLDLSKMGVGEDKKNLEAFEAIKGCNPEDLRNPLKTTKSDYSLHDSLKSYKDVRDPRNFKRRSIKKSSSGSNLRRLDSITELPKELISNLNLQPIEESRTSIKQENTKQKPNPKLKTKITSSVEVSIPASPLKFIVENVTVEEKPRIPRKGITYSCEVEEVSNISATPLQHVIEKLDKSNVKKTGIHIEGDKQLSSPETDGENFWDTIGKRETVYLKKRKQNIDEAKEINKRALFWYPEEEAETSEVSTSNKIQESTTLETSVVNNSNDPSYQKPEQLLDKMENVTITQRSKIMLTNDISEHQKDNAEKVEIKQNISLSPDTNTIKIVDTANQLVDKVKSKSKLTKATTVDDTPKSKIIGKSASFDTINENKAKVPSQKKTKSEKTRKALKIADKSENKSLQVLLPKPIIKPKQSEKSNIDDTVKDKNKKQVLSQNKVAVIKKLEIVVSDKQTLTEDTTKDTEKPKIPCPIHPFSLQKVNEECLEPKIIVPEKEQGMVNDKQKVIEKTFKDNKPNIILPTESISPQTHKDLCELELQNIPITAVNEDRGDRGNVITDNILSNETPANSDIHCKTSETEEAESNVYKNLNVIAQISSEVKSSDNKTNVKLLKGIKTDNTGLKLSNNPPDCKEVLTNKVDSSKVLNKVAGKVTQPKVPDLNKDLKVANKILAGAKSKNNIAKIKSIDLNKNNKTDEKVLSINSTPSKIEEPSTSNDVATTFTSMPATTLQIVSDDNSLNDSSAHAKTKLLDVPDKLVIIESQHIPNIETESQVEINIQNEDKTGEDNKAENTLQKDDEQEKSKEVVSAPKRPVKEEKAVRPLIATPRPLQKKAPQVIHSSDSSDSSSDEESSEEDDDSESSGDSTEFFECDNNPDGRTSTGSNDSGFDSSAPASPATFSQIKKDCDVNCHRKCEKLTANLCGVNQRLLVEALASRTASKKGGEASATTSSSVPAQQNNTDILEQELEQSTAYDIFRKTGRFTPPARSIPRFRKYTIEDFQFIKVLGKGSFGKVLLAELRDTEYYYAVKCLKKDVVLEDDDVECTLIERKVLALGTNHPYLCHLFATFQTESHLFFVMEYLNGGDLMFHIQQSGRFPEARARFYAAEIVSGLKFLHKRGIVYRDLKLDNILLDFEGHVRIADFGMCKLQIYLDKTADTFCGTPDYMAPEIIKGLKYNQTVDWWSFGVLLYEMLIGQSPFSGCDEDELFWSICNEMPSYPRFLSHEALTILTRLLDKDARTRLGGTECMYGDIRDQQFFHAIHWDRLDRRELEAPFRPRVRHPMDTQYFDRAFTGERPRLTAVEPHVLRSMDQEPFRGFSYTNPNTTDR